MTLEEAWNYKFVDKYPKVYFTGPKLTIDPYELVVRLDSALNAFGLEGNDYDLRCLIHKWQHRPESPDKIVYEGHVISKHASINDIITEYSCSEEDAIQFKNDIDTISKEEWSAYDVARDKFNCYWGQFTDGWNIFHVNLISSSYGQPYSWFNPKTGKVGGCNTIGNKWPESLAIIKKSVEWFVSEFPEVDLTLSIVDMDNIVIQLHLINGKIEVEDPDPKLTLKKLNKLYESPSMRYSDNHWYFNPIYLFYRRHLQSKRSKHKERCNSWKMSRHYHEQFFNWETIQNMICWWDIECLNYWKDHSFNNEWTDYKLKYLEDSNE